MQQLQTITNLGQTGKPSKVGKKSEVVTKSQKAGKNKLQFTEIFGQQSLNLLSANVSNIKQTEAANSEATIRSVKTVKTGTEGARAKDQRAESTEGRTDTSKLLTKQAKVLAKTDGSESAGEITAQSDIDQLISSLSKSSTTSGSKVSGKEKSDLASTIGSQQSETDSANKGTDVSKATIGSEMKIADLMLANSMNQAEKTASRAIKKESPEASASSINSTQSNSARTVNSQENTKNGDKEAGSEAAGGKTRIPKTEIAQNAVTGEKGVVEFAVGENGGSNVETTMLSKSQADLLVSKMIQQIKVAPSSLEVSLKPEYLGKINILVQSLEGIISVHVMAQNSEALNLLNANLQNIKDNLEQQGIKVQQLDVNIANQEKQDNQGGSRYRGESQVLPQIEQVKASTEYGSGIGAEISSLSSNKLNILA